MKRYVLITDKPVDEPALVYSRRLSGESGAVVQFSGVVRGNESGEPIRALEYETFQQMAEHQLGLLLDQMENRWAVQSVRLIHRVGSVPVNETSLWVEVLAPHRAEAFAACAWLIDELKLVVPIWKKPVAGSV
jgi:molybdopterin synthase catalytic subunit